MIKGTNHKLIRVISLLPDSNYYAPVRSRFVTVSEEEGNLYHLAGAFPRDHFPYTFEKGTGIIVWTLPGLTIKITE